ncbi:hypothetical protein V8G54_022931 [Vigna mungo]|uniref:Uncharacterized protein n=1 Tax=Vigna mungo TaxID=3915 RepID=A0AAQ3N410_VIGMU
MQARRDKNLSYNSDERYTRGHRCKLQFLLLTTVDTDDPPEGFFKLDSDSTTDPPLEAGLISLHTLLGQWNPRTFRVTASINGYNVQILVDSGATHNFIQIRVAQFLQLPLEPTASPLQAQLPLVDHTFHTDLYPLELSGTDFVLGVHWLSLSTNCDASNTLTGLRLCSNFPFTPLLQLLPFSSMLFLYNHRKTLPLLYPKHLNHDSLPSPTISPPFSPPPRPYPPQGITIILSPSSHTYDQSPSAPTEIEVQVQKMLESGFIKPSTTKLIEAKIGNEGEGHRLKKSKKIEEKKSLGTVRQRRHQQWTPGGFAARKLEGNLARRRLLWKNGLKLIARTFNFVGNRMAQFQHQEGRAGGELENYKWNRARSVQKRLCDLTFSLSCFRVISQFWKLQEFSKKTRFRLRSQLHLLFDQHLHKKSAYVLILKAWHPVKTAWQPVKRAVRGLASCEECWRGDSCCNSGFECSYIWFWDTIQTRSKKNQPLLEGLSNRRGRKARKPLRELFPSPERLL